MSLCAWKDVVRRCGPSSPSLIFIRHRFGHRVIGKPPNLAKSLQDRLQEENKSDPRIDFKVDIGLPPPRISRDKVLKERLTFLKKHRSDPNLEKQARTGKLLVDLEVVKEDLWQTSGPQHLQNVAEHYGVFQHLFGDAYFTPRIKMEITFPQPDDKLAPVHCGNVLKPCEVKSPPHVNFVSEPETLWTLALTNPDGHFTKIDAEYVHWFIGNIPGSDLSKGEVVWDYLQPFPPKGTGYQRLIFILYQQTKKINYSALGKCQSSLKLSERTFSTLEFYREHQDVLTPAGLAFFQTDWDDSLKDFFHNTLNMKEPVYEYDFPAPYIRPQEWFPIRRPFNLYMDKYRDPKTIAKEFLLRKLSKEHPFCPPAPPLRFPNAVPIPRTVPSWLALEKKKARNKWGRINDM